VKVYLWQSLEKFTSDPLLAGLVTAAIIGGITAFIAYSVFGLPILAAGGVAALAGGLAGIGSYYSAPKIHLYAVVSFKLLREIFIEKFKNTCKKWWTSKNLIKKCLNFYILRKKFEMNVIINIFNYFIEI